MCGCNQRISGMKKNKIAKAMDGDILADVLTGLTPGAGMIVAHELKAYAIPAMLKDGATDEDKNTAQMVADVVGIIAGLGLPMLVNGDAKTYAKGFGAGVAGQCLYSLYLRNMGQEGTQPVVAKPGGWDAKAYQAYLLQRQKAMEGLRIKGLDNNAPGLASRYLTYDGLKGLDNNSPGLANAYLNYGGLI